MPVAFNPPPFPTPDTGVAAATDNTAGSAAIAPDAFATLLFAAGGGTNAVINEETIAKPPIVLSGDDALLRSPGRIAKVPTLVISNGRSPSQEALRCDDAMREAASTDAGTDTVLDPLAMVAALSAVMASTTNGHAHPKTEAGTSISGTLSRVANATPALSLVEPSGQQKGLVEAPIANVAASESSTRTSPAIARETLVIADHDARFTAASTSAAITPIDAPEISAISAFSKEVAAAPPSKAPANEVNASAGAHGSLAHPVAHANLADIALAIETPVAAPGFAAEFAGKLAQVITVRNERAEFHLHPAELGPVDVKISFAADQAVVLITAAQPATRDALEQALPQLRDMLAGQGIALGQATVQSGSRDDAHRDAHGDVAVGDPIRADDSTVTIRTVALRGLVDIFA